MKNNTKNNSPKRKREVVDSIITPNKKIVVSLERKDSQE